jgi:hypothetical protein
VPPSASTVILCNLFEWRSPSGFMPLAVLRRPSVSPPPRQISLPRLMAAVRRVAASGSFAAAASASQLSGGLPASSIFLKTQYASVLLPYVRSVFSSLTQAMRIVFALELNRKKSRKRPAPNFARNQCFRLAPSVSPWRKAGAFGSFGMTSRISFRIAARSLAFGPSRYATGFFAFFLLDRLDQLDQLIDKQGMSTGIPPVDDNHGIRSRRRHRWARRDPPRCRG